MKKKPRSFTVVRDGVLEHHKNMTWAEIAVFHHLLNRANRWASKGRVGLVPGLTGRKLAVEMGKDQKTTSRALRGLIEKDYAEQLPDGIFIPKFESGPPVSQIPPTVSQIPPNEAPESESNIHVNESNTPQLSLLNTRRGKTSSVPSLASSNPFSFVCFWQDADEQKDFSVKVNCPEKLTELLETESKQLAIAMSPADVAGFIQRSMVKFTATYSKRGRNGKTRGARIGPKRLTEEFVAWIRSDLVERGNWQARGPTKAAQRVRYNEGLAHTDESRADSAAKIDACPVDHERDRVDGGGRVFYCPKKCGWVKPISGMAR